MDIVKTYNPANAHTISDKEISSMRDLTDDQIEDLAKAYPNQPTGNSYLIFYMTNEKAEEQRYPLGTWETLRNLRKLGRNDILPFNFSKKFFAPKNRGGIVEAPKRTVDLSEVEVEEAKGLKKTMVIDEALVIDDQTMAVDDDLPFDIEEESPELIEARAELKKAIDEKAHHMTVKKYAELVEKLENQKIK